MAVQQPTKPPTRFLRALKKGFAGRGLSLRKVASQVGITPAFLSLLLKGERGVPSGEIIRKLEQVLDIQPRGLLFDAAGRHDGLVSKVLQRDSDRILMRSLGTLSADEFAQVVKVAEDLAKTHKPHEQ